MNAPLPDAPYPGLRPFKRQESAIFFGRAEQIARMLTALETRRFLAVLGASGSGKSSLVSAGLLPALSEGFLMTPPPCAGNTDWLFVTARPGDAPFDRLADEFCRSLNPTRGSTVFDRSFAASQLRSGPRGFVELLRKSGVPDERPVLWVADQFEELFRYRDATRQSPGTVTDRHEERNAAIAFVDLMLSTARQTERPVYVLLTMRSDFLGDCDAFFGLPEAISDSQFLTPRLTREQLSEAISGPLGLFDATIAPEVINQIANEIGTDPDQLPLMQHALLRMWRVAQRRGSTPSPPNQAAAEPDASNRTSPTTLTTDHYRTVGHVDSALNKHAQETYDGLTPEQRRLTEWLFRCMGRRTPEGQLVRSLTTIGQVADVAGLADDDLAQLYDLVATFAAAGRNFLVPVPGDREQFSRNTRLDISHESLLRQWKQLRDWVTHDSAAGVDLQRLLRDAQLWQSDHTYYLREPELSRFVRLREQIPSPAWAARYISAEEFQLADSYLARSRVEKQRLLDEQESARRRELEAERRRAADAEAAAERQLALTVRQRELTNYALFAAVFAAILLIVAVWKTFSADAERTRAQAAQRKALKNERAANNNLARANFALGRIQIEKAEQDADAAVLWWAEACGGDDADLHASLRNLIGAWSPRERRLVHDAYVHLFAFSPDGRTAIAGDISGTTRLWDLSSGAPKGEPLRHSGVVVSAVFTTDGRKVLTASEDGRTQLWDARTGVPEGESRKQFDDVVAVALSPDGRTALASNYKGVMQLWDIRTGMRQGAPFVHSKPVNAMAFSPDGQTVLTGSDDATARLWDAGTGLPRCEPMHHEEGKSVRVVAFSPDGKTVLTGSDDATARLWDARTGLPQSEPMNHDNVGVTAAAFSADGQTVVTAGLDGTTRVWDARNNALISESKNRVVDATSIAFSPDLQTIVARNEDGLVRLWDIRTSTRMKHDSFVKAVAFSPDGLTVLTGCSDGTARLWDPRTGKPRGEKLTHQNAVDAVAFSLDGQAVLTHSIEQSRIGAWDAQTGSPRGEVSLPNGAFRNLVFSADGRTALTWDGDVAPQVRDALTGTPRGELLYGGRLTTAALSRDGQTVLTAYEFDTMLLWDARTGAMRHKPLKHDTRFSAAAIGPDGHTVLTGSFGEAQLWDARTGARMSEPLAHHGVVAAVAFSPDGHTVITADRNGTAKLWDVRSGTLQGESLVHVSAVVALAFSPDGQNVVTGCEDLSKGNGEARLWRLPPPAIVDPQRRERLRLSVEVRTGKILLENGVIQRLSFDEWNSRRLELNKLGGPCDRPTWEEYDAWMKRKHARRS